MDPSLLSTDTIKMGGGLGAAVISNLTGIPFDRFRVGVAQDLTCRLPMSTHLAATFQSPGSAFTGGFARIAMKQMASSLNLYVPQQYREEYPFLSNFVVGVGFSPLLNIPRMLQLGRIGGQTYPQVIRSQYMTAQGWKGYASNTMVFGPGEGFRMMMCFGTKDFLMPKIGGKADAQTVHAGIGIPLHTAQMALIAGPLVAAVETTSAVVTETVSTIQAGMQNQPAAAAKKDFMAVLKETATPAYSSRCWVSLFTKNVMANTPLFWFMFAADYYGRLASIREKEQAGR